MFGANKETSENKQRGSIISIIVVVVILLAALIVFGSSFFIVRPNEYKVVKQFGKIRQVISEEGPYFKTPFIQTVQSIPKQKLLYDLASSDVITSDKKSMIVDCYAIWKITDPKKFTQTLGASVGSAEQRIDATVYNAVKNTISGMTQDAIIKSRDGNFQVKMANVSESGEVVESQDIEDTVSLSDTIQANLSATYSEYGIEILKVDVKRLDLPNDNKDAVYGRMISERNNIAAQFTAEGESEAQLIRNKTDKEVSIMNSQAKAEAEKIMAEGEAEYMRILSGAYNDQEKSDFYTYVRSLDAAKKSLNNEGNTLILSKDSPIAQIFY